MRTRLITISAVLALALLLLAIAVASGVFVTRFDAIEATQTHEKSQQLLRAVQADLNQLAISARDYGEWDDTHDFIQTGNPDYLRSNFSHVAMSGMQVDVLAMFRADGSTVYTSQLDEPGERTIVPAPAGLVEPLRALRLQHVRLRELSSLQRLLHTPQGLLAFSAVEIRRSDRSAPSGAVMFFGRFFETDEIHRINETSQLPGELLLLPDAHLPPEIVAWTQDPQAPPTATRIEDAEHIVGYALLRDLTGQPAAVLKMDNQREIGQLGRYTTELLMGTLAALLLLSGFALVALLWGLQQSWADRVLVERRYRNIMSNLDETIVLADPTTGAIVDANQALLSLLDYQRIDVAHLKLGGVYVGLPDPLPAADARCLIECRMRARDGRLLEAEVTLATLVEDDREFVCVVGRDVSRRKQAEASLLDSETRLAQAVERDDLTGLPTRVALQRRLPALLAEAARRSGPLLLLHLDVDHFKNFNDSRGHAFGDRVLHEIAARLSGCAGEGDQLFRTGGDEFLVVSAAAGDVSVQRERAHALLKALAAPFTVDALSLSLTGSIGTACYPQDGADAEALLKHADIALYEAKAAGRNTHRAFDSAMTAQRSEHVTLEQALRHAMSTEQIYLEYQPVVDLHTGLLVSFEALARWKHPELGQISPARFIPVAEQSGLIVELGERIARDVIAQLQRWQQAGVPLAPIAINVAPVQIERTSFATFVHELLLQHDVPAHWLAFEVTESAWMQNSTKHVVTLDSLRHAGSRVYIDDFGTGFSNLSYLKTLPVDAIKIDQAFVRAIETDEGDVAIVEGIVAMARKLRLQTIAEGIETAGQAEVLRSMGCQFGQGYYFSRPSPAAQCRALLEQVGETRRFTETVKIRAFRSAKSA